MVSTLTISVCFLKLSKIKPLSSSALPQVHALITGFLSQTLFASQGKDSTGFASTGFVRLRARLGAEGVTAGESWFTERVKHGKAGPQGRKATGQGRRAKLTLQATQRKMLAVVSQLAHHFLRASLAGIQAFAPLVIVEAFPALTGCQVKLLQGQGCTYIERERE